mmetsp:Transcript_63184/g.147183  ORF Transcript_63184/g.147183 Transcript_63184/m.147183 type:complete len:234 (+) Transcript_63184:59-760(+)
MPQTSCSLSQLAGALFAQCVLLGVCRDLLAAVSAPQGADQWRPDQGQLCCAGRPHQRQEDGKRAAEGSQPPLGGAIPLLGCTQAQVHDRHRPGWDGHQQGRDGKRDAIGWLARSDEYPNCHLPPVGPGEPFNLTPAFRVVLKRDVDPRQEGCNDESLAEPALVPQDTSSFYCFAQPRRKCAHGNKHLHSIVKVCRITTLIKLFPDALAVRRHGALCVPELASEPTAELPSLLH